LNFNAPQQSIIVSKVSHSDINGSCPSISSELFTESQSGILRLPLHYSLLNHRRFITGIAMKLFSLAVLCMIATSTATSPLPDEGASNTPTTVPVESQQSTPADSPIPNSPASGLPDNNVSESEVDEMSRDTVKHDCRIWADNMEHTLERITAIDWKEKTLRHICRANTFLLSMDNDYAAQWVITNYGTSK
jgi:hypothetical protein